MVFSQTSLKAHSILKVVEIDRLMPEKNRQVNGLNGVITGGDIVSSSLLPPAPNTSLPEVSTSLTSASTEIPKLEPVFESTMFHNPDSEFFQDLVGWFSDPAKAEPSLTTDFLQQTDENVHNTDTLHTPFSPQGWESDSHSSGLELYNKTPTNPLSPNVEGFTYVDNNMFYPNEVEKTKMSLNEELNIIDLPVVLGELGPEQLVDLEQWQTGIDDYNNTHTEYTSPLNTNNILINDGEDSLDEQKTVFVQPRVVEGVIDEELDARRKQEHGALSLSVNIAQATLWNGDIISTPDIVTCVQQLECEEKNTFPIAENFTTIVPWFEEEEMKASTSSKLTSMPEFKPVQTKIESTVDSDSDDGGTQKRKRRNSEELDWTYDPSLECKPPRKYKKKTTSADIIRALEEKPQARRGRPPKRRESAVSSVCTDDSLSCISIQESKYREQRDKNNEASKRSRMKRKLNEMKMEEQALELEEKNKFLRVKAKTLEEVRERLKDALMMAMLQK